MNILADLSLPNIRELFNAPFKLTLFATNDEVPLLIKDQDILICRSTLKVDAKLLSKSNIKIVATASSGIDHIDANYLHKNQIKLFDAKGSNADSVADYILATIAYLKQNHLLKGVSAGVMGVGEVGRRVCERLKNIGFDVLAYDPLRDDVKSAPISNIMQCDLICLHMNLHQNHPHPSFNLLNYEFLKQLNPNTTIINAARGNIVVENDLIALKNPIQYCTDVYSNEPNINPAIIDYATICTPHIAGHSIEAKKRAVLQLSIQIHEHFNLKIPIIKLETEKLSIGKLSNPAWIKNILQIYNPIHETLKLKQALEKNLAFSLLRKAHKRHEIILEKTI